MEVKMSDYFSGTANNLVTVRDWLRFAVSRFNQAKLFFGHGSSDPYDEAAYLILHTLHLPLDRLEPFLDARLTDSERAEVLNVIQAHEIGCHIITVTNDLLGKLSLLDKDLDVFSLETVRLKPYFEACVVSQL